MIIKRNTAKRALLSCLTGAVNGLFGGGGGMVAVPLLKNACGLSERCAHATAILIIAPVCAAGAIVYIFKGYLSLPIVIPAAVGSAFGGVLGAKLLNRLPAKAVSAVFIAVMFAAGARMLF